MQSAPAPLMCMCGCCKTSLGPLELITMCLCCNDTKSNSMVFLIWFHFSPALMSGVCLSLRWLNWSWILSVLECVSPGGNISWWPPAEHPVVLTGAYQLHMRFSTTTTTTAVRHLFRLQIWLHWQTERDQWDVTRCPMHTCRLCCKLNNSMPQPCGLETHGNLPWWIFPVCFHQMTCSMTWRVLPGYYEKIIQDFKPGHQTPWPHH